MRVLIVLAILAATALAQEDSQNYFVKATTNVNDGRNWEDETALDLEGDDFDGVLDLTKADKLNVFFGGEGSETYKASGSALILATTMIMEFGESTVFTFNDRDENRTLWDEDKVYVGPAAKMRKPRCGLAFDLYDEQNRETLANLNHTRPCFQDTIFIDTCGKNFFLNFGTNSFLSSIVFLGCPEDGAVPRTTVKTASELKAWQAQNKFQLMGEPSFESDECPPKTFGVSANERYCPLWCTDECPEDHPAYDTPEHKEELRKKLEEEFKQLGDIADHAESKAKTENSPVSTEGFIVLSYEGLPVPPGTYGDSSDSMFTEYLDSIVTKVTSGGLKKVSDTIGFPETFTFDNCTVEATEETFECFVQWTESKPTAGTLTETKVTEILKPAFDALFAASLVEKKAEIAKQIAADADTAEYESATISIASTCTEDEPDLCEIQTVADYSMCMFSKSGETADGDTIFKVTVKKTDAQKGRPLQLEGNLASEYNSKYSGVATCSSTSEEIMAKVYTGQDDAFYQLIVDKSEKLTEAGKSLIAYIKKRLNKGEPGKLRFMEQAPRARRAVGEDYFIFIEGNSELMNILTQSIINDWPGYDFGNGLVLPGEQNTTATPQTADPNDFVAQDAGDVAETPVPEIPGVCMATVNYDNFAGLSGLVGNPNDVNARQPNLFTIANAADLMAVHAATRSLEDALGAAIRDPALSSAGAYTVKVDTNGVSYIQAPEGSPSSTLTTFSVTRVSITGPASAFPASLVNNNVDHVLSVPTGSSCTLSEIQTQMTSGAGNPTLTYDSSDKNSPVFVTVEKAMTRVLLDAMSAALRNQINTVTTTTTTAASDASAGAGGSSGGMLLIVIAVVAILIIVLIVIVVVKRRGNGGAAQGKSTQADRAVVAFENPMYDDPGTAAVTDQAIYDNGDEGEGLYDEPAFNEGVNKANPMYASAEDLADDAMYEGGDGYLDTGEEEEGGYLDVAPEDEDE